MFNYTTASIDLQGTAGKVKNNLLCIVLGRRWVILLGKKFDICQEGEVRCIHTGFVASVNTQKGTGHNRETCPLADRDCWHDAHGEPLHTPVKRL